MGLILLYKVHLYKMCNETVMKLEQLSASVCQMSLVVRKPVFCICENKDADQLRGNREADQRLCFYTRIVQSLFYLNPKFQASSHLLWLYSLVCVRPGRKPRRPVFSERGSYVKSKRLAMTRNRHNINQNLTFTKIRNN